MVLWAPLVGSQRSRRTAQSCSVGSLAFGPPTSCFSMVSVARWIGLRFTCWDAYFFLCWNRPWLKIQLWINVIVIVWLKGFSLLMEELHWVLDHQTHCLLSVLLPLQLAAHSTPWLCLLHRSPQTCCKLFIVIWRGITIAFQTVNLGTVNDQVLNLDFILTGCVWAWTMQLFCASVSSSLK